MKKHGLLLLAIPFLVLFFGSALNQVLADFGPPPSIERSSEVGQNDSDELIYVSEEDIGKYHSNTKDEDDGNIYLPEPGPKKLDVFFAFAEPIDQIFGISHSTREEFIAHHEPAYCCKTHLKDVTPEQAFQAIAKKSKYTIKKVRNLRIFAGPNEMKLISRNLNKSLKLNLDEMVSMAVYPSHITSILATIAARNNLEIEVSPEASGKFAFNFVERNLGEVLHIICAVADLEMTKKDGKILFHPRGKRLLPKYLEQRRFGYMNIVYDVCKEEDNPDAVSNLGIVNYGGAKTAFLMTRGEKFFLMPGQDFPMDKTRSFPDIEFFEHHEQLPPNFSPGHLSLRKILPNNKVIIQNGDKSTRKEIPLFDFFLRKAK